MILIWFPCQVIFRMLVWWLKRATLDLTAAVWGSAEPTLKCAVISSLDGFAWVKGIFQHNLKKPISMCSPRQNTKTKSTCHSIQGYPHRWKEWKKKHFFFHAEYLADCFDWSHRGVRDLDAVQPTIDSYTWEGLRGISGNKSCVKMIFWCGALSAYWFVIICTNSGEGGTMPSITVWK